MAGGADIAVLKAVLDTQQMKQGAQEGARSIDQLAKSSDQLAQAQTAMLRTARQVLGILGISAFGAWIKGSIDLAARYETLGVVLSQVAKAAGYTNQTVNALTDSLQKQGVSMLQARQSVISMIQAKLDLAKADKLAEVAQNAAVTAGLNSSETLQRIIFGITTAQTDVLRTVGVIVQFEDAYRSMAQTLRKSTNDLTAAEKAQARVNAVIEAGKPIAGAYAASMETAGKQVKSMERYVEDFRIKFGQAFQPAYATLIFGLANAVKFLGDNMNAVLVVFGAFAGRAMLAFISKLNDGRQAILNKIAASKTALSSNLELAKSEGLIAEATMVAARAKKADLEAQLVQLQSTKAAILAERELALAKRASAQASIARQVPIGNLAPLGGAAVAREQSRRAGDSNTLRTTINDLAILGTQQGRVNEAIAQTEAGVRKLNDVTSVGSRVTGAFSSAWNLLGGALGVALITIGAFYTTYSAYMQRAKEEIDKNADAIKKTLDDLAKKRESGINSGFGDFNDAKVTAFEKKVRDLNRGVEEAQSRILSYSVSLGDFFGGIFKGSIGLGGDIETLVAKLRVGDVTVEEFIAELDRLDAKYPGLTDSIQKAREQVALLAVKQAELNKFLADTPVPLLESAKAMDLFANAAKRAQNIGPAFIGPELGDKGRDNEREIRNLQRLQTAIRSGNQEIVRSEKDRQAAEATGQALMDSRIKGNEKLVSIQGKTIEQLLSMGPVADRNIAQLQVDVAATIAQEKAKSNLVRTNERLAEAEDKVIQRVKERNALLRDSGAIVPKEQAMQERFDDYRRTQRKNGVSDKTINADIDSAKRLEGLRKYNEEISRGIDLVDQMMVRWREEIDLKTKGKDTITVYVKSLREQNVELKAQITAAHEGAEALRRKEIDLKANAAVEEVRNALAAKGHVLSETEAKDIKNLVVQNERLRDIRQKIANTANTGVEGVGKIADMTSKATNLAGNLAQAFGEVGRRIGAAFNQVSSLALGINRVQTAGIFEDAAGKKQNVGFSGAIRGAAGASGVLGAAAGAAAIASSAVGVFKLFGDAFDLFGNKSRERERVIEERAKAFNRALDQFAITDRSPLADRLNQNIRQASDVASTAGYTRQITSRDDLATAVAFAENMAGRKNPAQGAIQFRDALKSLLEQFDKNTAAIQAEQRAKLQASTEDLEVRRLVAQGKTDEADARRQELEQMRDLDTKRKEFNGVAGAEEYIKALEEVQKLEREAAAAIRARAAIQKAEDERRSIFDLNNEALSYTNPAAAADAAFMESLNRRLWDAVQRGASEAEQAAIAFANAAAIANREAEKLESNKRTSEDLVARTLALVPGRERDAEDASVGSRQRQETMDAERNGMSELNRNLLAFQHFVERETILTRRAIEDGTKIIEDRMNAQLRKLDQQIETIRSTAQAEIDRIDSRIATEKELASAAERFYAGEIKAKQEETKARTEAIDRSMDSARQALDMQQEQIDLMQQQVDMAREVVTTLTNLDNNLKLGEMSILSPEQKLAEARAQFDALVSRAQAGDSRAAVGVADARQNLLRTSRDYYGSNSGYVEDYKRAEAASASIVAQYAMSLPIDEATLEQAKLTVAGLQQSIEAMGREKQAIEQASEREIANLNTLRQSAAEKSQQIIDELVKQREGISADATAEIDKLEETRKTIIDTATAEINKLIEDENAKLAQRIKENEHYKLFEEYAAAAMDYFRQRVTTSSIRIGDPLDSPGTEAKETLLESTAINQLAEQKRTNDILTKQLENLQKAADELVNTVKDLRFYTVDATNQVGAKVDKLTDAVRASTQATNARSNQLIAMPSAFR